MSSQRKSYDFVVVGAGVMGVSTALYLVQQFPKAQCALIEQYQLGHNQGSSHSQIRIIRSTYHHPFYRDLCIEGMEDNWPFVEKLLGDQFIVQNPFLSFVEHQTPDYKQYQEVALSSKNIKQVSIEQMRKMYPYAPRITTAKTVFVQEKAGIVLAQKYLARAKNHLLQCPSLDLLQNTELLQISNDAYGVSLKIKCKDKIETIKSKKVSLSCGRWIGKLVPEVSGIVKQVRQTVSYWKLKNAEQYKLGKYPSWIYVRKNSYHYSLPDATGDGIKYACHRQDPQHQKKFVSEKENQVEDIIELKELIQPQYGGELLGLSKVQRCYYSVTKTEDFLIDWTDQHENVLICSPCSGHGFKFGPIIGKIVADLLKTDHSIQLFEKYRYLMRLFYHLGVNLQ